MFLKRGNTSSYLRGNKSFGTKRFESCLCQLMLESLGRVKVSQLDPCTFCSEQHILGCKQSYKKMIITIPASELNYCQHQQTSCTFLLKISLKNQGCGLFGRTSGQHAIYFHILTFFIKNL